MRGTLHGLAATHELAVLVLAERLDPSREPIAEALSWLRTPGAHPSDRWFSSEVFAELITLADDLAARLVVVESVWLHRYVDPLREHGYQVIIDAHGVEAALQAELAQASGTSLSKIFAERTLEIERMTFAMADQVWVPSERDAALARSRYERVGGLAVVPNVIDLDQYQMAPRAAGTFTVTFTASFDYPPNVHAAGRLLTGIFPLLRARLPEARLSLVGRQPSAQMRAALAAAPDGIEVTGEVEEIAPYLAAASAMAVPLSEGHGTRFKVLEAFASRLPVVATRKAVEGLDVIEGRHYLAAETDTQFADTLARLAAEPELGAAIATEALELVRDRHSLAAVADAVNAALGAVS